MRHSWPFLLGLTLLLLACIGAGGYLGLRAGEQAAVVAAPEAGASSSPPKPAPLARFTPDAATLRPTRSREELRQWLEQLRAKATKNEFRSGMMQIGLGFGDETSRELASLSPEEFRIVLELVEEIPKSFQQMMMRLVIGHSWMKQDREAGWAYLRRLEMPPGFPSEAQAMMTSLALIAAAEASPPFAAEQLVALTKEEGQERASLEMGAKQVIEALAKTDWKAAFDTVSALPADLRKEAITAMKNVLTGPQRDAYLAAVRTVQDEPLRREWQAVVAKTLVAEDSAGAARWIDSLGLPATEVEDMTREVFQSWKKDDPTAALEWTRSRLPEGEHPALLAGMVQSWAQDEPNVCGRWLGEQETGPLTDLARDAFARAIADKDRDSARAWAETISDAALREECLAALR